MRRSEVVRGFSSEDLAPVSRGCAVRSGVPGGMQTEQNKAKVAMKSGADRLDGLEGERGRAPGLCRRGQEGQEAHVHE